MPVRISTQVKSGCQERELFEFLSDWFKPTLAALVGRVQDTRDSCGNAITEEENILFDRVGGLTNIQVNLRVVWLHRDKGQKCHTNGDVEIEGIDGRQAANPEIFKIENCFLASEVFFDSPSGEVALGNPYDVILGC